MGWKEQNAISKEDNYVVKYFFRKKARFIIDENLSQSVKDLLSRLGWNTRHVSKIGLNGKSDKDIFSYAYKHKRMILTFDEDFLNDREFPLIQNPGIIILSEMQGSIEFLERQIHDMLFLIAPYYGLFKGFKIKFYANGEVRMRFLNYKGHIETTHCKIGKNKIIYPR